MDIDLLGNLPDEVICHILSFLTTKEAALTSILSKRWLNLFALVPNLDFDDSILLNPEESQREKVQIFMGFVDRVLSLQGDSPIQKLSLKCKPGVDQARINTWICNVLSRVVSELDLCIDLEEDEDDVYLPEEVFVSKTLVKLKLSSEFDVYWWPGVEGTYLPKLKSLCVSSSKGFFLCDDKIDLLLTCFPVLEELQLGSFVWNDSDETVSSPTLTKLYLFSSCLKIPKSVSFDTPSLLSFTYCDVVAEDYPLVNMEKLVEARIILVVKDDEIKQIRAPVNENEDDVVLRFSNVVKLMKGLTNVRELHLSPSTLEVLSLCCESMPVFNKVKTLVIHGDEARGWQAMPVLLRNCPHLENLYIEGLRHHVTDKCGDACDCIYRKDKGRSLKSCPVKLMKIGRFRGTMKEMNMIEHFLDYFPCLKEMEISVEENGPTTPFGYNLPVFERISDMIEEYKVLYSCNVQVLMSDDLSKKCIAEWEKVEALWYDAIVGRKPMPPPLPPPPPPPTF